MSVRTNAAVADVPISLIFKVMVSAVIFPEL